MQLHVNYTNIGSSDQQLSLLQEVVEGQVRSISELTILPQSEMDLFVRLQQHNESELILSFSIDLLNETFYVVIKGGKIEVMVERLIERLINFLNHFSMDQH